MGENFYGDAGGEAKRKYEKLAQARLERKNSRSKLQRFLAAVFDVDSEENHKEEAWHKGAIGEFKVGATLNEIAEEHGFVVLHDRAIPHSQANIDHILVTSFGVFVIDAKNYRGVVRIDEGELFEFNAKPTLYVGNRKQTTLVNKVKKQVEIVKKSLDKVNADVPVYGVLAFHDAQWPLFFKPREIDGILINGKGVEAAVFSKSSEEIVSQSDLVALLLSAFKAKG